MNLQNFISFEGRIGRQTFWLSIIVLIIIQWIVYAALIAVLGGGMMAGIDATDPAAMEQATSAMMVPIGITVLVFLWPSLAIYTKRWHDRDKSGWWSLIIFVPLIGSLWLLIECGFLRGTDGPNRFGPDPIAE